MKTTEMLYDSVPSLDLADFTSGTPEQKQKFVQDLGNAYQNIGFVAVKNHGLGDELTEKLYEATQKFFALPDKIKQKYHRPELFGQRGYVPKLQEQAKGHTAPDLKEFYHIGQEIEDENEPLKMVYPPNVWVQEVPEFNVITLEAYRTLEKTGKIMLRAIALFLELDENYFDQKVTYGDSILRPIHYFPIENPENLPQGAVRAGAHGDINLITLLMGASAEGLQVLRRDNQWIPITALPNQIVVNVGDMLERLTNDVLKSTIHRVVNPPVEKLKTSRFSMPFFMHARPEVPLNCLISCISQGNPKKYDDMTAREFLEERLQEIGLKK